jgi:hypothetical protein
MTREPNIPMSPDELPQQRIHEVVGLPERPTEFNSRVGYGVSPKGGLPKAGLANSIYLCQVEWAWSPAHNRLDAYYLHRGRSEWSLWSKYWDDNWMQWENIGVGCVPKRGVSQKQAAVHLLLDYWVFDARESDVDHFHWINEHGYLSIAELAAIAREVWG